MPVLTKGVLAIGGALVFCGCGPLGGTDPLDSGELSVAVTQDVPSAAERQDERKLQDERVRRLSGASDSGSTIKGSAGVDVSADF